MMVFHNSIVILIIIFFCQVIFVESQDVPTWISYDACYKESAVCYRFNNTGKCSTNDKYDIQLNVVLVGPGTPTRITISTDSSSLLSDSTEIISSCQNTGYYGITALNNFEPFTPTDLNIYDCTCMNDAESTIALSCLGNLRIRFNNAGLFLYEVNDTTCTNTSDTTFTKFILFVLRNDSTCTDARALDCNDPQNESMFSICWENCSLYSRSNQQLDCLSQICTSFQSFLDNRTFNCTEFGTTSMNICETQCCDKNSLMISDTQCSEWGLQAGKVCTRNLLPTSVYLRELIENETDSITDIVIFLVVFVNSLRNSSLQLFEDDTIKSVLVIFDELYDESHTALWIENEQLDISVVDEALAALENVIDAIALSFLLERNGSSYTNANSNHVVHVDQVRLNDSTPFIFPAPDKEVQEFIELIRSVSFVLRDDLFCEDSTMKVCDMPATISVSISRNLAKYLTNKSMSERPQRAVSHLLTVRTRLAGATNGSIFNRNIRKKPIDVIFNVIKEKIPENSGEPYCVFWNHEEKMWSLDGIGTTHLEDGRIQCSVSHFTSFAVLVSPSYHQVKALTFVSYIGCVISIVCLLLAIIIMAIFRKRLNKGVLLYVHLNLSVCLLLALLVFVAGVDTAKDNAVACIVVTIVLHYLFLCVFCWMLAEGIMLYLLVVRVFGRAADKWYYLMILGWGASIPVVALTAGVGLKLDKYTAYPNYCWLSTSGSLWGFLAPMILIIVINLVILILTIISLVRGKKFGGAETEVSNVELVKTAIKGTLILLPLLGITWIIGIFAVDSNTTFFAWLFTIFNSIQGVLIFILQVIRNEAVLRKIKSCYSEKFPSTKISRLKSSQPISSERKVAVNPLNSNIITESTVD